MLLNPAVKSTLATEDGFCAEMNTRPGVSTVGARVAFRNLCVSPVAFDTIGMNDKTTVDGFETPHTEQMHVVERFRLVDPETLEVEVYVEDPGAFTTPWTAIQRYSRQEGIARRTNVANVAMLASAGEGPLLEAICSENPGSLMGLETIPIAQSKTPDF